MELNYWFARGYYDGRTFGSEESQDAVDGQDEQARLAYKQGYDRGVADYCDIDIGNEDLSELEVWDEAWIKELGTNSTP